MDQNSPERLNIGIALSGGGSRAIAFHLGCLRTLHRVGILDRARVMSTVSGGSVIGAMYAVHEGAFDHFEQRVRAVLEIGFLRPAWRTAVTTAEGARALACLGLLSAAWAGSLPTRLVAGLPGGEGRAPRRFASRTTILERTFDRLLFGGRTLDTLSTDRPHLVAIATELRTGSAFYFGRGGVGSWRFGKVDHAGIRIARAVAASAAYPIALPALDEFLTFSKGDGSLRTERVTLSDGGVYDNLGLSPLWPDRDQQISIGVEKVDAIVACRAGYGLRTIDPSLSWGSRMKAAFGTVHQRAQNAGQQRLFDLRDAGRLRCFALPYLDQDDDRLAYPPSDLIRRTAVMGYPTNFSAMPREWIEKLSKRGEQLTLAVLRQHAPELLAQAGGAQVHTCFGADGAGMLSGALAGLERLP